MKDNDALQFFKHYFVSFLKNSTMLKNNPFLKNDVSTLKIKCYSSLKSVKNNSFCLFMIASLYCTKPKVKI